MENRQVCRRGAPVSKEDQMAAKREAVYSFVSGQAPLVLQCAAIHTEYHSRADDSGWLLAKRSVVRGCCLWNADYQRLVGGPGNNPGTREASIGGTFLRRSAQLFKRFDRVTA